MGFSHVDGMKSKNLKILVRLTDSNTKLDEMEGTQRRAPEQGEVGGPCEELREGVMGFLIRVRGLPLLS